jgi:deoxycytidylate deaminase
MTRHEKRLKHLATIADDASSFDKNRHAAAIYIGTELVAIGVNQMKSHPLQKRFGKNEDAIFLHAEMSALVNALKRVSVEQLKKATLYVARSRHGVIRMSKPCLGCQSAIIHFGIQNVFWTEDI